jgi:Zn-dependent protease with chaperone function
MARILKAMLLALAIPAVALIAILAADGHLEEEWRTSIVQQFGPQTDAVLDRVRLTNLCQDPEVAADLPTNCEWSTIARVLKPAGIASLGLSLLLFVLILPLRRVAQRNRRILALFRPALRLLLLALVVIVLLNGGLIAGGAYLVESVYAGSVHPYIMFAIAVVVILAAAGVLRAALTMGRVQPIKVQGLGLERERDPELFELVDEIAARVGATSPDQIVAGLDATFFVTEGPVKAFDDTYRGRTLFLSVPFIRILARSELMAIIGHELGHFRGDDTVFSRRFYPVYRGSIQSLGVLQASARGWTGIPLLPPLLILELFFRSFVETERDLSRQREFAADLVGAEAASTADVGVALIKLEAYHTAWGDAYVETTRAIRDHRTAGNISTRFAQLAQFGRDRAISPISTRGGSVIQPTLIPGPVSVWRPWVWTSTRSSRGRWTSTHRTRRSP